ncbi:High-affinity glucose transporter rgt2 [Chytriomyces hyalinus]|nr:High-affinity glucose transporter rgt2 [Chytriomyces hyalinus]KAJ3249186.1 High-affinity glucose transporter rgt2 [Chytriomyces hyalinus]
MSGKTKYSWLVALAAGIGGFLFGYEIGVIGQVLGMESFKTDFNLNDASTQSSHVAWVTTSFLFGCIGGAAIFSVLADRIGRKYSIISSGLFFAMGGALQCSANSFAVLLAGRVLSGVSIGTASMVVPLYMAETAPAATRGALTTIYQLMITFGIFVASCVNSIIIKTVEDRSSTGWRMALAMQIIPSIFLVILVYFIPFSPRWLAEKGRHEEGLEVMAKLRGLSVHDQTVVDEYNLIREASEIDKAIGEASWGELFRGTNGKRMLIAMLNQSLQQLTGINVILYYSVQIFQAMGFDHADTLIAFPLANSFVNFIATFPGMWAVDRYGRKPLLVWGGLGMAVGHAGVYTFLTLSSKEGSQLLAWGAIISVYIFLVSFASTWGPVVWSYQAEIFPLRVRAKGTGFATVTNWTWNAIIAYAFPFVFSALDKQPTVYWIFFTFCLGMSAWAWYFVPETKGLTLEEVGEVFGDKPMAAQRNTHYVSTDLKSRFSTNQMYVHHQ